jgi:hypothetical protein
MQKSDVINWGVIAIPIHSISADKLKLLNTTHKHVHADADKIAALPKIKIMFGSLRSANG